MKTSKKSWLISPSAWLIIGIALFVAILLGMMLYAQSRYSHNLKQITLKLNTGLASPELWQTSEIIVTSDSCRLVVIKQNEQKDVSCTMDSNDFSKIQKAVMEYRIVDKIIANNNHNIRLADGGQATMTVVLKNGDRFSTDMSTEFIKNLGPFFEEITLIVPSFEKAIPVQ